MLEHACAGTIKISPQGDLSSRLLICWKCSGISGPSVTSVSSCSNPRFRERTPGRAPARLYQAQADKSQDAEAREDQQSREIGSRVLAALAHHVRQQEAAKAAAAAHEACHDAKIFSKALWKELKYGTIAH